MILKFREWTDDSKSWIFIDNLLEVHYQNLNDLKEEIRNYLIDDIHKSVKEFSSNLEEYKKDKSIYIFGYKQGPISFNKELEQVQIIASCPVFLCNDEGKTIERIN